MDFFYIKQNSGLSKPYLIQLIAQMANLDSLSTSSILLVYHVPNGEKSWKNKCICKSNSIKLNKVCG